MLSYVVPVEEKPPLAPGKSRFALELMARASSPNTEIRKPKSNISKESSTSSFVSDLTVSSTTPANFEKPKHKLLSNGTKHTSLKRVSFGSSKGSMVETLIYESPLQEEPEPSPTSRTQETFFDYFPTENESDREKVRVSYLPGTRTQCVSPPLNTEYQLLLFPSTYTNMAEHSIYNRQISTESGWDNPFRPDGDLSREADEIVSLIKGGKPITPTPPTGAPQMANGAKEGNADSYIKGSSPQTKKSSGALQSTPKSMNGAKNGINDASVGQVEVQHASPQEPLQAEHVNIKKKPMCKCCVIQ